MPSSTADRDVKRRVDAFNANRDPARLERKYKAMRASAFDFFRGTAHLFWEDWAKTRPRTIAAPLVWSCGDAHLENFGSFRGDNRLVYFDLNDFDEAGLGPATADITRLLSSAHVAALVLEIGAADAVALCGRILDAYATSLSDGKARWVERNTAHGMVRDMLRTAHRNRRRDLLAARTTVKRGQRRIRIDGQRTDAIPADERSSIQESVQRAGDTISMYRKLPGFYEVLDVSARIAGLSSLGLHRYVVLVRGRGGSDGNYLLDLKEVRPSSMVAHLGVPQPRWQNEAERVVLIQQRMQAISPALLTPVSVGRTRYVLRELQPSEDRLRLDGWKKRVGRLRKAAVTMAQLLAWSQLRSASRDGSATIDALIEFGRDKSWRRPTLDYAKAYATSAEADWREFREEGAAAISGP